MDNAPQSECPAPYPRPCGPLTPPAKTQRWNSYGVNWHRMDLQPNADKAEPRSSSALSSLSCLRSWNDTQLGWAHRCRLRLLPQSASRPLESASEGAGLL